MAQTTKQKQVQAAQAELDRQRVRAGEWVDRRQSLEVELETLQARAGDAVLEDPTAAAELSREMQRLRDDLDIASRAIEAAQSRVHEAWVSALLTEADAFDQAAEKAQVELDAFVAETDRLVQALRDHDGRQYEPMQISDPWEVVGPQPDVGAYLGQPLHDAVGRARATAQILRDTAAGRDPMEALRAQMSFQDGTVCGVKPAGLFPDSVPYPPVAPLTVTHPDGTEEPVWVDADPAGESAPETLP